MLELDHKTKQYLCSLYNYDRLQFIDEMKRRLQVDIYDPLSKKYTEKIEKYLDEHDLVEDINELIGDDELDELSEELLKYAGYELDVNPDGQAEMIKRGDVVVFECETETFKLNGIGIVSEVTDNSITLLYDSKTTASVGQAPKAVAIVTLNRFTTLYKEYISNVTRYALHQYIIGSIRSDEVVMEELKRKYGYLL